ncbi:MAG TPA: M28 family peptidase [Gaiellaceae bacterium]|nr:M28 family peptidase [Gaiellaceae bacterium]
MEAAPPREVRRRPRRGSIERPLNTRLVRTASLGLLLPLAIVAFTVSRPGPLPAPTLPPSFDGTATLELARQLTQRYPNRTPGSAAAEGAARWFADTLAGYGISTETDTWTARIPGLGPVSLHNVAAVVPGESPGAIAFLANRDTTGVGSGANDDATGTAALIQLARAYATVGTTVRRPRPVHTLLFVSLDAGAFGSLGAARFVDHSRFRHALLAAVVLDGIGGRRRARLELAGDRGRSPAPSLVRTAIARVREQTGAAPRLPGVVQQLVDLGLPFAYGDQAPLLGARIPAVRLTTADDSGRDATTDTAARLDATAVERLGTAAESLLGSLDAAGDLAQGTGPALQVSGRVVRGWALALLFISGLVPFGLGAVDLLARVRRHGGSLAPAWRALRRRLGFWLVLGGLVWVGAALGLLPGGPARPLAPASGAARDWPVGGTLLLGTAALAAWFVARARLVPRRPLARTDELAGYVAALAGLLAVAIAVAVLRPLALIFVLPSLYAWLWLPQTRAAWLRDVLYGVGLSGAAVALVSLAERLSLGVRAPLYVVELASTGYVPWTSVLLVLAWAAVAAQLGALTAGRYGPYAGGARRPPRGAVREAVRRAVLLLQSRRRYRTAAPAGSTPSPRGRRARASAAAERTIMCDS